MRPDSISHPQSTHRLPQQEMASHISEFEIENPCQMQRNLCQMQRKSCQMQENYIECYIKKVFIWNGPVKVLHRAYAMSTGY